MSLNIYKPAEPRMKVVLAPYGAEDLGCAEPCLVHHQPGAMAPWSLVTNRGKVIAGDGRRLRARAARLGLVVDAERIYLP